MLYINKFYAEDLDMEIDFDRFNDEDEYRDEIFGELNALKDQLYEDYLQTIQDLSSEE